MEAIGLLIMIGLGIIISLLLKFKKATSHNFKVIHKKVVEIEAAVQSLKGDGATLYKTADKAATILKVDGQKLTTSVNPVPPKVKLDETEKILENVLSQKDKPVEVIKPVSPNQSQAQQQIDESLKTSYKAKEFEKIIGENWLNKIGIAVLVLGLGFFVKYAIDQNWINETGRVLIGVACAGVLIGIAHFMRKKYQAFSSVLIGGGISTLYYTLTIAYQYYGMFSQTIGFTLILLTTILATVLAILYNRKELAVIALLGAFTAPFMVAGNTPNYTVFFTYIAIVNSGMLALSFAKKWQILHYLSFGFTFLFFGFWVIDGVSNSHDMFSQYRTMAMVFGTIYFVQFLGMILSYSMKHKIPFKAWEMIHLIGLSGAYFGLSLTILDTYTTAEFKGIYTLSFGAFFGILAFAFRKTADPKLIQTLIGKLILFATLSILLLFNGSYTVVFWSAETVLLFWLAFKTKEDLFRKAGFVVQLLAIISIVVDWTNSYALGDTTRFLNLNTVFYNGLFVLIAMRLAQFLLAKQNEEKEGNLSQLVLLYKFVLVLTTYAVFTFEINDFGNHIPVTGGKYMSLWIFNGAFVVGLLLITALNKKSMLKEVSLFIGVIFILAFLTIGHPFVARLGLIQLSDFSASFVFQLHYVLTFSAFAVIYLVVRLSTSVVENETGRQLLLSVASIFILAILCSEMDHTVVNLFATTKAEAKLLLGKVHVAGYTVTWAVFALLMMVYGLRKNIRILRVFALGAFFVTLVKLFTYDISNISTGGKIIAFISLGIILLVVSFLYQKLKKLIVEGSRDEE